MIINPKEQCAIRIHSGVPHKSLGYMNYCLSSERLVIFESIDDEPDCSVAHWAYREGQEMIYPKQPELKRHVEFIKTLALEMDLSYVKFTKYFGEYNVLFEIPQYELRNILSDIKDLIFDLKSAEALRLSRRALKEKLKSLNIDWKTCHSLVTESKDEFLIVTDVIVQYLEITDFGNYVFWFQSEDVFCMLCHEDDIHLYFLPDKQPLIDKVIDKSGIVNNTKMWPSYYPCY